MLPERTAPLDGGQQLSLPLGEEDGAPHGGPPARLLFRVAAEGGPPFDDDGRFFEPWWPGAPAYLRRDGRSLTLQTELLGDALPLFPLLRETLAGLQADGLIVEGTLLALDMEGRPDQRLLRRLLDGSEPAPDRAEGAFVAADLPWLEGRSLTRLSFTQRRRRLATVMPDTPHYVLGRGLTGEARVLARAIAPLGLRALSARRLDAAWRAGPADDAWLRLTAGGQPSEPTRPFLVLLARLPLRP